MYGKTDGVGKKTCEEVREKNNRQRKRIDKRQTGRRQRDQVKRKRRDIQYMMDVVRC